MVRNTIWDELQRMRRDMDRAFNKFFETESWSKQPLLEEPSSVPANYREPLADVIDKDDEVVVRAELPGINKKDVEVTATDDGVTIRAEKKREETHKKGDVRRVERSYTGFHRYIALPRGVDVDNAQAESKDGVLTLRIPKREEAKTKTKRIEVK